MKYLTYVGLAALSLTHVACGNPAIERDGFIVESKAMQAAEEELIRKASDELACERGLLRLTLLGVYDDAGADMPTEIEVRGCRGEVTFVRNVTKSSDGKKDVLSDWVMSVPGDDEDDEQDDEQDE